MLANQNQTVIALIPDGWELKTLYEIAKLRKEIFKANVDINLPYIGLEHIEQDSLRLISVGNSSEIISNKFKFYSDDILYGKLRPYFRKVNKPKFDGVCSTDIWVIKSNEIIDNDFLYYLIATEEFTNIANSGSTGTKMPRADWEQIKNTKWKIPKSINEQKNISEILSSLDDKIELNRKMNETLEKIVQTIFKHWFLDFEFHNEEGKPYKSSGGKMIDSELGEIPQDWEIGTLGDLITLEYGKGLKESDRVFGNYSVIGSNGIIGFHNSYLVNAPGIVVGRKGTIGGITWIDENFYPIDTTFYVKPKINTELYFFYFLLNQLHLDQLGSDSAVPGLNRNFAYSVNIKIPPRELIMEFNQLIESSFEYKRELLRENKILTNLRDSLLPKLMSGKIRVKSNA